MALTVNSAPADNYQLDRIEIWRTNGGTAAEQTLEGNTFNMPDYDVTVKLYLDKDSKFPTIQKCPEGIEYLFRNDRYVTEESGAGVITWLNSRQRDKDAIVQEGSQQADQRAWFTTLSESEQYLARKYASEIKAKKVAEPIKVETPDNFKDVEEL
jgi:hypothetical protein